MSGLLGIWNSQQPAPWPQMLQDLQVLGPNGMGDWHGLNGQLSLGRTQFFNTPESQAEPPVVEHAGCVLVWEGRLDDRESLLAGHIPPMTDGQLIIESYRRWGIDCIDRLMGEYAFILWDAANDLLLVGCDPVGKRVVAYSWDGQTLLVSSRVLTLLLHPQVSQDLDPLYLANTLCGFLDQERGSTPFQDIKRLMPGRALILKAGQLQEKHIAQLQFPRDYDTSRSPESYYEEFWHLLNTSVKDCLRTIHRSCTTLSGGLDSTTVTVALFNHLPKIDAFSTITSIYPEYDEREPIQTFLQMYPQTQWNPVNSDHAWSFSESWDKLPVTDDPVTASGLAKNIHLMEQIQQHGFGQAFDGEFGDNLCAVRFTDLVRTGRWGKVKQLITHRKRWPALVFKEFVLRNCSPAWQRQWFEFREPIILPSWITPNYAQSDAVQQAIHNNYAMMLPMGLAQSTAWAFEAATPVAVFRSHNLMRAFHRFEPASPLQDRRIIEFAARVPPELHIDPNYGKIFLRQANKNRLPDLIRWRPKNNYFDALKYAGIGKGQQVLELLSKLKQTAGLCDLIDVAAAEKALLDYRTGYAQDYCADRPYRNMDAHRLHMLFTFVNWHYNMTKHISKQQVAL
jgi:asparagine synthase (glutamine-hydrolysing)